MKVKCIDNSNSAKDTLTVGQIYIVTGFSDSDFYLEDIELSWSKKRFEVIYPFKVKCVDDSDQGGYSCLVKGNIYSVCNSLKDGNYVIYGVQFDWKRTRFELMPEESNTVVSTTESKADISDWKAWRGQPPSGHCFCGCPIELCRFHSP